MAEARRELGRQTMEEYARTWLPRQRKTTEYSTAKTLASRFRAQINPVIGSRKLNAVTPTVVEDFLDHLEAEGVGRGHQLNVCRALSALLRDAFEKGPLLSDSHAYPIAEGGPWAKAPFQAMPRDAAGTCPSVHFNGTGGGPNAEVNDRR
ncbi:N-terminal phage integrase SAM-like domain-containing protein [Streptomyces sp. NTH33]|uniref:N-terminal phage integrase SAM-like domain-containing protein n=1 Tax=Streptomyces sp. NTH33 TaxID=1735453 RepID=UPI0021AC55AF|nr:N-terminal phage integrase SAM-like domain-containing protein [Streptomyces sp. NTH33]